MLQIRRAFGGSLLAAFLLTVAAPWSAAPAPDPQPQDQPADASTSADLAWPRIIEEGGTTFTVFQPQIDKFDSGVLEARAAVQVETHQDDHTTTTFGVIWIKANTAIDKENRLVQLDDIQIVKANFPTAGDKVNEYLDVFRNHTEGTRTISLDRVEANLAITNAGAKGNAVPIKNDPPRVFFRSAPAVLVLIDGDPALRPVDGSPGVDRVINTRTLILRSGGTFFMPIADRWVSSAAATGPWQIVPGVPAPVQAIRDAIANDQEQTQVDLMEETNDDVKGILAEGRSPEVIVSTVPAELIVTQGPPQMKPVGGTQLLYVTNTTGDILFDLKAQDFYVPLTGRWFRSKSLDGPWQFVAGDQLPPDFAKIPTTEPKSTVLATVPGTPASQEAQIANSIPQTAEINRAEATFQSNFDGDPQFQPVQDTSLQWAINSPTPVIRVNPTTFFAVQGGVWFTAGSPMGPWTVATVVPPVIYTIPVASPIHYCTFVRVFRFNPTTVWVGYTPGYLGTCFSPWGTVVFGTGWFHRPWIGRFWFGRPWTWGFGAGFWWSRRSGWGWGFGWGGVRPVFNPWWGPFWGWRPRPPIYRPPMFPGRPVHLPGRVGRPNWNNVNVYNRAGRPRPGVRPAVVRPAPLPARPGPGARPATRPGPGGTSPGTRPAPGTRPGTTAPGTRPGPGTQPSTRPAPSQPATRPATRPTRPADNVFAGNDGNVYRPRPGRPGSWETNQGGQWRPVDTARPESRPAPSTRPAPSQPSTRPAPSQPSTRPAPSQPSSRPAPSRPTVDQGTINQLSRDQQGRRAAETRQTSPPQQQRAAPQQQQRAAPQSRQSAPQSAPRSAAPPRSSQPRNPPG